MIEMPDIGNEDEQECEHEETHRSALGDRDERHRKKKDEIDDIRALIVRVHHVQVREYEERHAKKSEQDERDPESTTSRLFHDEEADQGDSEKASSIGLEQSLPQH